MIHFKPGSHAYNIIDLLSVTGEFPLCSLEILGSRQTYENAIRRMLIPQKIVDGQEDITCKLLTVSGQNGRRKIRLTKDALPILKWLGADKYYYENYMRSHRSSSSEHTIRNARFAESVAMFRSAGYEFRPHKLPKLQVEERKPIMGSAPVFYPAKMIKTFDNSDVKKTGFTRMTGALLAYKRAYVVYNTRNELMKGFEGGGEIKAWLSDGSIAAFNADCDDGTDHFPAIMFGKSYDIAVTMLKAFDEFNKQRYRRKKIRPYYPTYYNVYFFTMDTNGVRQLRLMKYPDWEERILTALFDKEELSYGRGFLGYDAYADGIHWFSFLNGDICGLHSFKMRVEENPKQWGVICFPHQLDLIWEYVGKKINVGTVTLDDIEKVLFG